MKTNLILAATAVALVVSAAPATAAEHFVPHLTYRTGPFAANGSIIANGFLDYMTMINERDGGVGGVKVKVEECETGYNAQKGVECYESTKARGALVSLPNSTGITLQLLQKAQVDKIPLLTMGYGLSAAAAGEKFPWAFNFPTTYWGQMSSILSFIGDQEGGGLASLKGKKVGFIYLDVGYGREPIPLLDNLAAKYGFDVLKVPVAGKEMQNQSSHWLTVRKEKPDWMIMWGWGAMNSTAVKAAMKIRYPMDHFIGNWWSSSHVDTKSAGMSAKGYRGATFSANGTDFPAIQDVLKHAVNAGKTQTTDKSIVGNVLYNRGMINAVVVVEAIGIAQKMTGKKEVTGEDMRAAFENVNIDEARLKELGLTGFMIPMKSTCKDHAGSHPVIMTQWDGKDWNRVPNGEYAVLTDEVAPLLKAAAEKYVSDKPTWKTQTCS
jgi:branched-chain amino acid transport system substrate-binding protein